MAEANSVEQAELTRRILDIVADRLAADDCKITPPWTKRKAQREHVGVRAHAGIAKQVPRPADTIPTLQDGECPPGTALLEAVGGIDAGNSCSDDQHV